MSKSSACDGVADEVDPEGSAGASSAPFPGHTTGSTEQNINFLCWSAIF